MLFALYCIVLHCIALLLICYREHEDAPCPVSVAMVVADDTRTEKYEQADVKTVITVLLLREIFAPYGDKKPRVISEILDPRTKELLQSVCSF